MALFLCAVQACCAVAAGQQATAVAETVYLDGYVSATHWPNGFDVNGQPVVVSSTTSYEWFGSKDIKGSAAESSDVQVGVYAEVTGTKGQRGVDATAVSLRATPDKTIKGLGLIVRVIAAGPEPVFEADGYRIRVPAGAATQFAGTLKTLADVGPNTWVKYEGKRDANGDVVAAAVEFSAGKTGKKKPAQLEKDAAEPDAIPAQAALIDASGNFKTAHQKVRLSDVGGPCGWHRLAGDAALQARVWSVGTSVVPAYQRQMAEDDAARIHFRFYVVDEAQIREAFGCAAGLILVPKQVVDRLKNDSQLAAVLADGVAFNLQEQSPRWTEENMELAGSAIGGGVAGGFFPWAGLGTEVATGVLAYMAVQNRDEELERIELTLVADAGYDPWQAPEAWRLLAPKKLPADSSHLKYPNRAGYQLATLNLQYRREDAAKSGSSETKADAAATK